LVCPPPHPAVLSVSAIRQYRALTYARQMHRSKSMGREKLKRTSF